MACGCGHKTSSSAVGNYIATGDAAPDPLTNPPAGLPPGTTTYTPPTDWTPLYILAGGGLLWALLSGSVAKKKYSGYHSQSAREKRGGRH